MVRKKYRETRSYSAIPIDDVKRLRVLENFIEIFEANEPDTGLISALQSILAIDKSIAIV